MKVDMQLNKETKPIHNGNGNTLPNLKDLTIFFKFAILLDIVEKYFFFINRLIRSDTCSIMIIVLGHGDPSSNPG